MKKQNEKFPLETLPKAFQDIILSLNSSFSYPVPYSAIAMIAAVATAVGTTLKLRFKQGFEIFGNIYCYFISDPGTCKTHPISWMFAPIAKDEAIDIGLNLRRHIVSQDEGLLMAIRDEWALPDRCYDFFTVEDVDDDYYS